LKIIKVCDYGADSNYNDYIGAKTMIATYLIIFLVVLLITQKFKKYSMIIKNLQRSNDNLKKLSLYDPLTGLPNNTLFEDRFQHAFNQATRAGSDQYYTLLYLDVNNFKPVNDLYGHDAGDQVLKNIAQKLSSSVRPGDTVARLHGDEFAIILQGKHAKNAISRINKLTLGGIEFYKDGEKQRARVGFSVGAVRINTSVDKMSDLIKIADRAMYRAKDQCRNSGLMSGHAWSA
jgi:diguanylate cyclase (GGDEF)-like protein